MGARKWIRKLVPLYAIVAAFFIALAEAGSRTVTVMANNVPIERGVHIVIDAGHGGEDGGATSCTGVPESRLNLEIALRLDDLLHLLGYDTVMIRTSDTAVYTSGNTIAEKKISDLKHRVQIVNQTENALLLSIHQNTFPEGKYSGAQVFYASAPGSMELAEQMQTAFVGTINPGSNRKCKKSDGVYLMEHINCTGVLVECGFLSNPEEEAKLRSADYQNRICCVIASTAVQYLMHNA